ncbi:hypothetical protein ABT218_36805 [Streptomyces sp. NPDC001455]|uniref:hypothetical protein n=1 Tax=Streptomyces sp. NPDC001455 TaxID=3154518 RepID=UPI0033252146
MLDDPQAGEVLQEAADYAYAAVLRSRAWCGGERAAFPQRRGTPAGQHTASCGPRPTSERLRVRERGQGAQAAGRSGGREDDMGDYEYEARDNARAAAKRFGEDKRTDAIGEGLASIALALLEVASAIRENTTAHGQHG